MKCTKTMIFEHEGARRRGEALLVTAREGIGVVTITGQGGCAEVRLEVEDVEELMGMLSAAEEVAQKGRGP